MIEHHWNLGGCVVVRIREDPLRPLAPHDVWVRAHSKPIGCVQAVLLHLIHTAPECLDPKATENFLQARIDDVGKDEIVCKTCGEVGDCSPQARDLRTSRGPLSRVAGRTRWHRPACG